MKLPPETIRRNGVIYIRAFNHSTVNNVLRNELESILTELKVKSTDLNVVYTPSEASWAGPHFSGLVIRQKPTGELLYIVHTSGQGPYHGQVICKGRAEAIRLLRQNKRTIQKLEAKGLPKKEAAFVPNDMDACVRVMKSKLSSTIAAVFGEPPKAVRVIPLNQAKSRLRVEVKREGLTIAIEAKLGGAFQYVLTVPGKTATGKKFTRTHRLEKDADAIKALRALSSEFHFQNRRRLPTAPKLKEG